MYREVKAGRLSPPIKVGERASAFPSEEIDRFIAERIRESRKTQRAGTPAPIPEPQA
ncbi:MAG: hypothetical protein K8F53_05680 [Rhodocyclaceae bacterium]|nr:hypothetical protein [Rhodocyclaceae bacterium]